MSCVEIWGSKGFYIARLRLWLRAGWYFAARPRHARALRGPGQCRSQQQWPSATGRLPVTPTVILLGAEVSWLPVKVPVTTGNLPVPVAGAARGGDWALRERRALSAFLARGYPIIHAPFVT